MNDDTIPDLRTAMLHRLRFERDMGIECARPVALERVATPETAQPSAPVAPAASTASKRPAPAAPAAAAPLPASAPFEAAPPIADMKSLSPEQKAERWKSLEARALGCTCCVLHKGRTKVVFGEGNRSAHLVFVGEGPGEQEDLSGRPFVGKAGQLLDKIIGAMGLQRDDVYICNVVKCRPPGNRTPLPDEVALCNPYLEEQLALIAPKAIVALGSPAAKALLKTTQGIMALRGRWQLYRGIRVMPTYHPAFVLRQYTDEVRRAVWNDMKQVTAHLQEG